jgi:hypothetical protein
MGITIHFLGTLRSKNDLDLVLQKGQEFARRKSAEVIGLNCERKSLIRVINDKVCEYEDAVTGICFQPHEHSEPMMLQFDSNLYIHECCKTQYAGISSHIEIIQFLREIEPHFKELKVNDEGEFWESNDIDRLEQKFDFMSQSISMLGEELDESMRVKKLNEQFREGNIKFLNELFKPNAERHDNRSDEHSVIIYFNYFRESLDPLHDLAIKLEKVIAEEGVGVYDGHETAMDDSHGFLYMYGPNAEELFKVVKPILEQTDFTRGALATLRFGGAGTGAKEIDIEIEK